MQYLVNCYRCGGEGIVYKYLGDLGSKSTCPGCHGKGSLSSQSCFKCVKCKGEGRYYQYKNELGRRLICPFCQDRGYTTVNYTPCQTCGGEGKIYAFHPEKIGVPITCKTCSGYGYFQTQNNDFRNNRSMSISYNYNPNQIGMIIPPQNFNKRNSMIEGQYTQTAILNNNFGPSYTFQVPGSNFNQQFYNQSSINNIPQNQNWNNNYSNSSGIYSNNNNQNNQNAGYGGYGW